MTPPPRTVATTTTLRTQVGSAIRWSALNSVVARVLQLAVGVLVARLVAPEQFGVFAVALVVLNLVLSVSEMGVSVALVRTEEPLDRIAPTVTTLCLASGAGLAAVCFLGAPWFAGAMNAPAATGVIQLMAVALLFAGASAVPGAILQREFRQDHKFAADTAGFVVGTVVVVVLALAGFGAWSLAWSRVATNATSAVVMIALTPQRFAPGFDPARARELLGFGLPLAGSSLLVLGVLNVDYVVTGAALGPIALGLYLMAFNLSSWPVSAFSMPVRTVSLPAFSRLRDDPEQFGASFVRALRLLAIFTVPACVLLGALGEPLLHVLYGVAWTPAAVALAPLVLVGGLRVVLELAYDFLASAGRTRTILWIHVAWLACLVPLLAAGAALDGIRGIALAHLVAIVAVVGPTYYAVLRPFGIRARPLAAAVGRPVAGGAAMVLAVVLVGRLTGDPLTELLLGGVTAAAVYAAVAYPMRHEVRSVLGRAAG